MTLILHILIAISSLIITGATYFAPTRAKLRLSYIFVGLTLATGTYLVLSLPGHLVSACEEGLVYLAVVAVGIALAQRKLAAETE